MLVYRKCTFFKMHVGHILISVLFWRILSGLDTDLKWLERNGTESHCDEITNHTAVIHYAKELKIDYKSYINSNVQMIEEPAKITFYSCLRDADYLQVSRHNYYPIDGGRTVKLFAERKLKCNRGPVGYFYDCLELHCFYNRANRLYCTSRIYDSLNIVLKSAVTYLCVQNITYANIWVKNVSNVANVNHFFQYANNLVYLVLRLKDNSSLTCSSFIHLQNLRVAKLWFDLPINVSALECMFRYNPNLVKIEFNGHVIWNQCTNFKYSESQKQTVVNIATHNTIVKPSRLFRLLITCVMYMFAIIVIVGLYFYYRHQRQIIIVRRDRQQAVEITGSFTSSGSD